MDCHGFGSQSLESYATPPSESRRRDIIGGLSGENHLACASTQRPARTGCALAPLILGGHHIRTPQSHKLPCGLNSGNVTDPMFPEFSSTTTIRTEPAF